MSSLAKPVAVFCTVFLIAACEAPDRYPISGEDCGPDDPVKTMDSGVMDCIPAV